MNEKTVMTHMLSIPDLIRKKQLSDAQINLVRYIQSKDLGLTTLRLSDYYEITTQAASTRLKALWLKGYLSRSNIGDDTGGTVYRYRIVKELRDTYIPERSDG